MTFRVSFVVCIISLTFTRLSRSARFERNPSCECKLDAHVVVKAHNLVQLIRLAADQGNEICCPSYGDRFGLWGEEACNFSLADLNASIAKGWERIVVDGGKSAFKPVLTPKYCLKRINRLEYDQLRELLYGSTPLNFIVPVCRVIKMSNDYYLTVSANTLLNPTDSGFNGLVFDLKGNWDRFSRRTFDSGPSLVLKDRNFYVSFPRGLEIERLSFNGSLVEEDHAAAKTLIDGLLNDTLLLSQLKSMDYSLIVNLVEYLPSRAAGGDSVLERRLARDLVRIIEKFPSYASNYNLYNLNSQRPLVSVRDPRDGKQYTMTVGIVDMLMRDDNRGFFNGLGALITGAECRPKDIDPILARPYRARFMRMFGYKDDAFKAFGLNSRPYCGACLGTGPEYTYFTSSYQRTMNASGECTW